MSHQFHLGNLVISARPGWLDITHDIDAENVPFTLAMNDGVGALQFSAAAYKSGQKPVVTSESLQKLVLDFALSRELGKGFDALTSETPILICAQSYSPGTEFTRVWYCSNGQDVALVTYTCEKGLEEAELPDCEKTVADLRFVR